MSAVQKGETVLITGGTGWLGSHIAHEALAAGLRIKLAIRNEAKAKTLIQALEKIHGKEKIETAIVKDYGDEGAYDEAVQGVQGIIHAASDVSFSEDPNVVIPAVLKAYNSILEAAHKNKSIRRFVLTSSSIAIASSNPGGPRQHLDVNTWNDKAVEESKTAPNAVNVYAASKVLSERAAWDFAKTHKPNFVINSINPNLIIGAPVPGTPVLSTGTWITDVAEGKPSFLSQIGPQYQIDVDDVAKLHVIATMNENVKNERILAYSTKYTFNSIIDSIKKVRPDAPLPDKTEEYGVEDNTTVNVDRANELLKDQGGLKDLDYSVRRTLQTA